MTDFILLNLGCGAKCSPRALNVDWSISLRLKASAFGRLIGRLLLKGERRRRFDALPSSIIVHDISKSIPIADDHADAIYLSHVLEHIDRDKVVGFLNEIFRKLKPDGTVRIVVPDLHSDVLAYLDSFERSKVSDAWKAHDQHVAKLIEQSVRREAAGSLRQPPVRRKIENFLLGDARKRGETHQWCYDIVNLGALLHETGFRDIKQHRFDTSRIPRWSEYELDVGVGGEEHRKGSLYVEGVKPHS